MYVGNEKILPTDEVKLLGVKIDKKLSFKNHIKEICVKANNKINALRRIRQFVSLQKSKLLYTAFVKSAFNYCPLIWMFCSKECNNLVNKSHKRALRIVYQDENSSYDELIKTDKSSTVHLSNLRLLICEIFKSLHNLNPIFIKDIFSLKPPRPNDVTIYELTCSRPSCFTCK